MEVILSQLEFVTSSFGTLIRSPTNRRLVRLNISNMRKSVSSEFQAPRSELKKRGREKCVWKSYETLFLVSNIILGEIQMKSSPNWVIIKVTSLFQTFLMVLK